QLGPQSKPQRVTQSQHLHLLTLAATTAAFALHSSDSFQSPYFNYKAAAPPPIIAPAPIRLRLSPPVNGAPTRAAVASPAPAPLIAPPSTEPKLPRLDA